MARIYRNPNLPWETTGLSRLWLISANSLCNLQLWRSLSVVGWRISLIECLLARHGCYVNIWTKLETRLWQAEIRVTWLEHLLCIFVCSAFSKSLHCELLELPWYSSSILVHVVKDPAKSCSLRGFLSPILSSGFNVLQFGIRSIVCCMCLFKTRQAPILLFDCLLLSGGLIGKRISPRLFSLEDGALSLEENWLGIAGSLMVLGDACLALALRVEGFFWFSASKWLGTWTMSTRGAKILSIRAIWGAMLASNSQWSTTSECWGASSFLGCAFRSTWTWLQGFQTLLWYDWWRLRRWWGLHCFYFDLRSSKAILVL